jgi:hypothetical protein
MGQKRAFNRGRVVPLLVAGIIGYLFGGWNVTALRGINLSASQTVAQRFPQDWDDAQAAPAATPGAILATTTATPTNALVTGDAQLALWSPEPMVSQASVSQASVSQTAVSPAPVQMAAVEVGPTPAPAAMPQLKTAVQPAREARPAQSASEIKPAVAPGHRHADRPGFVLNDAQLVSIKQRLNLTPDQERMWPAVEAALRNLAYTNAREAHRHGAPASSTQLASADPNSTEVQDLKSAAIPLIMSFNSEQKDEVRSLAHVMGLDQLASQF